MSMADWICRKLVHHDVDGTMKPPGAGPGLRVIEPDGSEVAAVARGDGFDLYFGKREITNVSITPKAAMRLAWWLVWWWVRHAWFGVKLRLWDWARTHAMERRWKGES